MRALHKKLILLFIILIIVKIGLSFLISTPTMFLDEYIGSSMARSFYRSFNFILFSSPSQQYMPLYPIILSNAYIFDNMKIVYTMFKIINALLSSLIIFPAWLLAKEFLNERKAFLASILCGIFPAGFIFSFFVMAENLFYVLSLFTIFFVYKSFTDKDIKWDFLAGLFLGLTYLTKIIGISLVFTIFIVLLIHLFIKKDFSQIKRKLLLYGIALLVVLPWLIRNAIVFGFNFAGIVGYQAVLTRVAASFSFTSMLYWILLYFSYLALATGIILFLFSLLSLKSKDEKLKTFSIITWVCIFCFILISAIMSAHLTKADSWFVGKPLSRYIEGCIPLIIILSFASLNLKESFYKNKLKFCLFFTALIVIAFKLFEFNLFPVNSISLSHIGLINLIFNRLISFRILAVTILLGISSFCLMLIGNIRFKKMFYLITLFFILINIIAFGMVYYNSNYRWEPLEQMQLGLWFNDNIDKTNSKVLFDERDNIELKFEERNKKPNMLESLNIVERPLNWMAFWMNADTKAGSINGAYKYDYVVTKYNLNYNLLKEMGEFKLYEIK